MANFISTLKSIYNLPKITIQLDTSDAENLYLYNTLIKPHPRFFIIKNKELGVEIIQLRNFKSFNEYYESVNGKNSAAYFTRKCLKNNYSFIEIDPNLRAQEIIDINISSNERQGRKMDDSYLNKNFIYPISEKHKYYGVEKDNLLVAYIWLRYSGELAIVNRILGHGSHLNQGIMYLLCTETVKVLFNNYKNCNYLMYDTFFGATDGLKLFKKRIGFEPYKVSWKK